MNKKYFFLFENCIPVKGAKNFIVCDLSLNRYKIIPEFIYYVFTELKGKSILEIKNYFENSVDTEFEKFISILAEDDWGFFTNDRNSFPEISFEYYTPLTFNNAVFDYDLSSTYDLVEAIRKIDKVGCQAIQIRFFKAVEFSYLHDILKQSSDLGINYIEVLIKNDLNFDFSELKELFKANQRLRKIYLHNKTSAEIIRIEDDFIDYGSVYLIKNDLIDETSCGKIVKENFVSDLVFFSESKKFNNCLNRKVSIDKKGLIKNCPSMNFDFGRIEDNDLNRIVKGKGFMKYWGINKDKVEICKDCEFRYICTDCRAYIVDPKNILSKPLKCKYDPYEGVWNYGE